MNIFITGASGFIGNHIVRQLSGKYQFYAMARTNLAAEKVAMAGAIPVISSLGKVTLDQLENCDTIIHAAAMASDWGSRQAFWESNVVGTQQLLDIAKLSDIRRFIHISSEAVLFTGQDLINIDESYPYPVKSEFLYSESKLESEKLVKAAHDPNKFETVVIRPRLVWGPGDESVLASVIEMIRKRRFSWIDSGRHQTSTTHIYNLVEGIKCVLAHWKGGETYFITDSEQHTYKTFLTEYVGTQGVVPPNKTFSKSFARGLADIFEFIWSNLNIQSTPPLTRFAAYMLSSSVTINHQKAIDDLNYQPVISFNQGIDELRESRTK